MTLSLNPGDRIRLLSMPADPDPIPVGTIGTVLQIHQHGNWTQVEINWDNGRQLMLTLPEDRIEVIYLNSNDTK